jgi:hypothetical protein
MSRVPVATLAGVAFILVYIGAAIGLPELMPRLHWTLEAVYWCVMGTIWVFPIWWLMLWAVHKR